VWRDGEEGSGVRKEEQVQYMDRPAARAAERVLTATFGGRVRLGAEEPLRAGMEPKANVRRCRVAAANRARRSSIGPTAALGGTNQAA
jgi:hypothetical protein